MPATGQWLSNGRCFHNELSVISRQPSAKQTEAVLSAQRPPGGTYFVSQANTSLCQYSLFFGLSTQCPSSGKLMKRDFTPCRWSAVKISKPWPTGQRKSRSFWIRSIGVLNL